MKLSMVVGLTSTLLSAVWASESSSVLKLTADNFKEYIPTDRTIPTLVKFYAPWCGHCKSLAPIYDEVAKAFSKFKGKVQLAHIDCDDNKELCQEYNVSGYPTLSWFGKGSGEAESYSDGRDLESLTEYITKKTGLSLPKPMSSVVVLTPENFDEIVYDPKKNVLVEFYAPWCGHCKSLAPIYEKVATAFANEPDVVIAKIDADTHKSIKEKVEVSGFPTIKFFGPNSSKDSEEYSGGRTEEDFVKFINEKAGTHRMADGKLDNKAGVIAEFNDIIAKIQKAMTSPSELKEIAKDALAQIEKAGSDSAKYYSKVISKIMEKGKDYIDTEIQRLTKMIESSAISSKSMDSFTIRKNILNQFKKVTSAVAPGADESEAEVEVEVTKDSKDEL